MRAKKIRNPAPGSLESMIMKTKMNLKETVVVNTSDSRGIRIKGMEMALV